MLDLATSVNVCPMTFWQLTPGELFSIVRGFNQRAERDQENQIVAAYLTAYWHRVKKMPRLDEVIGKKSQPKKQDAAAMLEEIKRMNVALGGTVY